MESLGAAAPDQGVAPSADAVLDRFFADSRARAARYGTRYVQLWEHLEAASRGGKRFRPGLVQCVHSALGGRDSRAVAHVGAAFELLHTALILHDDVVDRDFRRRGAPNLAGRYRERARAHGAVDADHRGMSAAIIAGDLALFSSYRLIDESGVGEGVRARLLEIMNDALFASAAGELIDLDLSLGEAMPAVGEIVEMERYKTAVYSFEGPLLAGAILSDADPRLLEALREFGNEIGIAFQLVDDLLGVFGDSAATGKTVVGDLREGKRTVLIAAAATSDGWPGVSSYVGKADLTEGEASLVRDHLESSGARATAERLAGEHAERARRALARPEVPDALRAELEPLVDTTLARSR